MKTGKTFIISGPSGVGKSTVLKALLERRKNLYFSVSATTREPLAGAPGWWRSPGQGSWTASTIISWMWIPSGSGSPWNSFWSTLSTWATSTAPPSGMWTRPWRPAGM